MFSKSILITGGAGFIGSHLIIYLLNKYPSYNIINLDALTYAGDLKRLSTIEGYNNYQFIQGNIEDKELIDELFSRYKFSEIIHLAAESHVDNSINMPGVFIKTNINGTFTLLEAARKYWVNSKNEPKKFLHISTDEVYGSLSATGYFTESSPYAPSSPYSASKAASDFLVKSYFHTYGLPVLISNCSNNYGPWQNDEKLIPTIIRKAIAGEEIPIYGNGRNIRDWLYVLDHCRALDLILHQGNIGENYNIGAHNEKSNIKMANLICTFLDDLKPLSKGRYNEQITFVKDRPGHDFRYAIDNSKICTKLNWQSAYPFIESLKSTVHWYINNYG